MNESAPILTVIPEQHREQDANANKAIREVASTPSDQHVIPAEIVAGLYRHVDQMRAEFFAGQLPEVVLSFDVTDKRVSADRGVRWSGKRDLNLLKRIE